MVVDAVPVWAEKILKELSPGDRVRLARLIVPASPEGELTQKEFDEACNRVQNKPGVRRFSDTSIQAVRLVLVMGATVAEAAAEVGTSRQGVQQTLARFRTRAMDLPGGWVRVDRWFPPAVAKQLQALGDRLEAEKIGQGESFTIAIND